MNYLGQDKGDHILKKIKNIGILLLYKIGRRLRLCVHNRFNYAVQTSASKRNYPQG